MSIEGVPPLDSRERRKRKREGIAVIFLSFVFIVLAIIEFRLTRQSNTLPFVNSIFFFGLLNINIIILIGLVWLVFRNIGKLFIERRRKILGARLKTKLVIAFLAFSIIPTLMLFLISAMYINSSFDKWFSIKVQNTLQLSLEVTKTYYKITDQNAMHFAEHLAEGIGKRIPSAYTGMNSYVNADGARVEQDFPRQAPAWVEDYLKSQRDLLALDAVEFYANPLDERIWVHRPASLENPETYPRLPLDLLDQAFAGDHVSSTQNMGSGDLIRCLVPVRANAHPGSAIVGVVVVNSYIPVNLVTKVGEIASVIDDYRETNPLKYPIKTTYLVILIMITLVIIFVAIWIGLYMARELTFPLEKMVYGAQAVGAGNLDVSISASGHDEISVLVESFNKMIRDLKENRIQLTQASADLEKRRLQLEAVLANIETGVIAVDRNGEVTTFNRAAAKLLEIPSDFALGKPYGQILTGESSALTPLLQRAFAAAVESDHSRGMGQGVAPPEVEQWNFRSGDTIRVLAAIATPLRDSEINWGVVAVIDDMTHLIKGQREMAWREVARRIAHEIKNPLTPIKLSAQRLQRRLGDYKGREGALLKECTETIIKHTDELKEMVNEFSNFARFPEISPAPHDLNLAIGEVIGLFQQGHSEVKYKVELEPKLPVFEFDRDQIKRVVINLFDNAIAALGGLDAGSTPQIAVATHFNDQLRMAVIEVTDNGPGMTDEVKGRVFEPYFSTKREGTGLGLAIVKRIVNDHDGFIRVHSAPGEGTKFVIELPTSLRRGLGPAS